MTFAFLAIYAFMAGFTIRTIIVAKGFDPERMESHIGLALIWPLTLPMALHDIYKNENSPQKERYLNLKARNDELVKQRKFLVELKRDSYSFLEEN